MGDVPLAEGVVVEPGEEKPPLVAIGDDGKLLLALAQPLQGMADNALAAADPQPFLVVDENGDFGATRTDPQMARPDRLARNRPSGPGRGDLGTARPFPERPSHAANRLKHEGDELPSLFVGIVLETGNPAAEAVFLEVV